MTDIPSADIAATPPLPIGTVIRLNSDPGEDWDAEVGRDYVIVDHVPHDPADDDPPADCYELEPAPGQGYWSSGEYAPLTADLTVVRTAADQQERMRMPSGEELTRAISSALHDMLGEDIEVYETSLLTSPPSEGDFEESHEFKHGVEFYGRRVDGIGFGGTLRLTGLWGTDD